MVSSQEQLSDLLGTPLPGFSMDAGIQTQRLRLPQSFPAFNNLLTSRVNLTVRQVHFNIDNASPVYLNFRMTIGSPRCDNVVAIVEMLSRVTEAHGECLGKVLAKAANE